MLMCWPAVVLPMGPIPMIICAALLVLVVRRAILCRGEAPTEPALEIQTEGVRP
jgi:hypothetical protein